MVSTPVDTMPLAPDAAPPNDPNSLRGLFLLRPGLAYLNHGSFGACPRPVFAAYQAWQAELEREPVLFLSRRYESLLAEARESLATYLGASADNLVYATNITLALNVVAQSLDLAPGDEILSTDLEYGAMNTMWQCLCDRAGARYVRQPIPLPVESAEQVVEAIWAGRTPRTRALFISHITSGTAMIMPVEALVRRAREEGLVTIVDGAHAVGQVPVDLEALGADYYAGNCHKWMMSPKGAGFLHARRDIQGCLRPLVLSGGYGDLPAGRSRFLAQQEWQGTRDPAAFLTVPEAIRFAAEHRWDEVRTRCHALLKEARARLTQMTGLAPLTPDSPEWYAQMARLPLPPCDGAALKARLYDEFDVEVPAGGGPEGGGVRISVQGYNTPADIDRLLEGLRVLLPQVRERQPA